MSTFLENIQSLPEDSPLRDPKRLASEIGDAFVNSKTGERSSPAIRGYRVERLSELGVGSKVANGQQVRDVICQKMDDGFILYDPHSSKGESGVRIKLKDNNGNLSLAVMKTTDMSRGQISNDLNVVATEMLGAFGVSEAKAIDLIKNAGTHDLTKVSVKKEDLEARMASYMTGKNDFASYKYTADLNSAVKALNAPKLTVEDKEFYTKTTDDKGVVSISSKPGIIAEDRLPAMKQFVEAKGLFCDISDGRLTVGGLADPKMIESMERNLNAVGAASKAMAAQKSPEVVSAGLDVEGLGARMEKIQAQFGAPAAKTPEPGVITSQSLPNAKGVGQDTGQHRR